MKVTIKLSLNSKDAECSKTHLDVPRSLPQTMETKLISDFSGVHGVGQVLLVGEDEEEGVAEVWREALQCDERGVAR